MLYYKPTPLYLSDLIAEAHAAFGRDSEFAGMSRKLIDHSMNSIRAIRNAGGTELLIAADIKLVPRFLQGFVFELGVIVGENTVRLVKSRYRCEGCEVSITDFVPIDGSVKDLRSAHAFRAIFSSPCKIVEEDWIQPRRGVSDRMTRLVLELGSANPDDPEVVRKGLEAFLAYIRLSTEKEKLENLAVITQ